MTEVPTISQHSFLIFGGNPPNGLYSYVYFSLDLLAPPFYVPVALFYTSAPEVNVSKKLKTSLSETLSSLYPFCGRLKEIASIDCSDHAVLFVEARACSPLSGLRHSGLQQFLPFPLYNLRSQIPYVMGRGRLWNLPRLRYQALLGCLDDFLLKVVNFPLPAGVISNEKLVTKSRFNGKGLAQLRAEFPGLKLIMVEAVTALIWKTALEVARVTPGSSGICLPSAVTHIMNIWSRAAPPLLEQTLGNLWQSAVAPPDDRHGQTSSPTARSRGSASEVYRKNEWRFCKGAPWRERVSQTLRVAMSARKLASTSGAGFEFYRYSSWTRIPFYEAEFGWGRPAWGCTTSQRA
ncbi:vinorine synthase-like [Punica granatum]|uniref:Vinorine synthase-like n=1 Tax=Punica granatum TaxID=22663 RepID=A0A6P8BWV1_PUNGR|nr:vinorine synthase-like [Punica granatum]